MDAVIKNKVYDYRVKAELTQEQLAKKVGVTRQTIIAIERGNYTPSVALALTFARAFSVRVEDIFTLSYA